MKTSKNVTVKDLKDALNLDGVKDDFRVYLKIANDPAIFKDDLSLLFIPDDKMLIIEANNSNAIPVDFETPNETGVYFEDDEA